MTVTDSDRIVAAGVTITVDGEPQQLRYSFRSLKVLEDHFGTLSDAIDAINRVFREGLTARIIDDLAVLVAAGLDGADPDTILDHISGPNPDAVISTAAIACTDAWTEAFPPLDPTPGKAEGEVDGTGSPGASSTTSPPSPAAAPTPPSGT